MSFTIAPTYEAETVQGHPKEEKEIAKENLTEETYLILAPTDEVETIQGHPVEEKETAKENFTDKTNLTVAPTDGEEVIQDYTEEKAHSNGFQRVDEEINQDYTEEKAHSNRFQAVETESATRMIRCNPTQGVGEKPSPSKTAVATPVPDFKDEEEQSFF